MQLFKSFNCFYLSTLDFSILQDAQSAINDLTGMLHLSDKFYDSLLICGHVKHLTSIRMFCSTALFT